MSLVVAVLAASLLGSLHCAGMCGGFVCFYAGGTTAQRRGLAGHAAYGAGRLVSYVVLGIVAGALGSRLDAMGRLAGVQRSAAVVAGTLMVAWGLARIAAARGVRVPGRGGAPLALQQQLGRVLRAFGDCPLAVRAALLGLVTSLLPCGWLWTFVLTAAASGSVLTGALVMTTFWLGTLPMMTALGVGAQQAFGPLRRHLPVVSAAVLVTLGLLSIAGKLQVAPLDAPGGHGAHAAAPRALSLSAPASTSTPAHERH